MLEDARRRSASGIFAPGRQTFSVHRYRSYPVNNSSPPSPDRATVTRFRVNAETIWVGICEGSANGSSYISANFGTTSRASAPLTGNVVCSVPRCRATASACFDSSNAAFSKLMVNVLTGLREAFLHQCDDSR